MEDMSMMAQNWTKQKQEIQAIIRFKKEGYKEIKCPKCGEKPIIERSLRTPGFLTIRCPCKFLNLTERGI